MQKLAVILQNISRVWGRVTGKTVAVTVVTGYLGSGKTTIIKSLLSQLSRPDRVVWLKNEYGDVNVDKLLVKDTNVQVAEILNGCLCCVLVGKLGTAIDEILKNYSPERIIIETSGTAYPAPIVWEIAQHKRLVLDGVINVVDCLNFKGYSDIGFAAKMQSKYIDLIIFNKWQNYPDGSSEQLEQDHRLDDVYELNPTTPKIKSIDGVVKIDVAFGLNIQDLSKKKMSQLSLSRDKEGFDTKNYSHEDEVITRVINLDGTSSYSPPEIEMLFKGLERKQVIRIKGVVNTINGAQVVNWVFGKSSWQKIQGYNGPYFLQLMGKDEKVLNEFSI